VGRWSENCGCATGEHPGWSQAWRAPLRHALDCLRDELAARFESAGREFFRAPWSARDDALTVLSGGGAEETGAFFRVHAAARLSEEERGAALDLLQMQRYAMLMFASCGWFFDDPAGLETRQILRFAARAIELAGPGAAPLEEEFLSRLEAVGGVERWSAWAAGDERLAASLEAAQREQRRLRPELDAGIGGSVRTGSLKCLHAHAAFALARPGYELGEEILAELPAMWPDACCTTVH